MILYLPLFLLHYQLASFLHISLDLGEAFALYIFQHDGRTIVGFDSSETYIIYFQIIHVAGKEAESRCFLGKLRLRIVGALLSVLSLGKFS